jgi:hypothetical protein
VRGHVKEIFVLFSLFLSLFSKHSKLHRLIQQERVALLSLVETQVKERNMIVFLDFFFRIGLSCIIMIFHVAVEFGFVGMLIW